MADAILASVWQWMHVRLLTPWSVLSRLKAETAAIADSRRDIVVADEDVARVIVDDPRNWQPEKVLASSDQGFAGALAQLLGTSETSATLLVEELRKCGRGMIRKLFRTEPPTYVALLKQCSTKLGIARNGGAWQLESAITLHCFNVAWSQMTPPQREAFRGRVQRDLATGKIAHPNFSLEMLGLGTLGLAQISGFGVYLAASTLVGAATHIVGLVLPFAFYTAMSSTIAFVIGPAGWTVLGITVLAKMFGPEYDLMIKGIVAISGARAELLVKWEQRLSAARDRAAAARQILRCRLSAWRRTFAQLVRVSISWLLLLTLGASLGAAAAMQVWRGMP